MRIIVIVADSKVNMHGCDISRIQEWIEKRIARFGKYYCAKTSFYPTHTENFFKIN